MPVVLVAFDGSRDVHCIPLYVFLVSGSCCCSRFCFFTSGRAFLFGSTLASFSDTIFCAISIVAIIDGDSSECLCTLGNIFTSLFLIFIRSFPNDIFSLLAEFSGEWILIGVVVLVVFRDEIFDSASDFQDICSGFKFHSMFIIQQMSSSTVVQSALEVLAANKLEDNGDFITSLQALENKGCFHNFSLAIQAHMNMTLESAHYLLGFYLGVPGCDEPFTRGLKFAFRFHDDHPNEQRAWSLNPPVSTGQVVPFQLR